MICVDCERPVHALDGAISRGGEPGWHHFDCEKAHAIDYAAAFDKLMEFAEDAAEMLWGLVEESAGDDAFMERYDKHVMSAVCKLGDARSWGSYDRGTA